ncbi:alpha/beta hydrolase [Micromonospora matsumotoense]|uniref:alpha/beta hydrolase n=1 Tax=Micromonospora matsumotoense TaxID=121616 RepID=UPI00114D0AB2
MHLGPYRSWEGQYLLFDEDAGRIAVVYGDPCHADRIAVLVPGANTRVGRLPPGPGRAGTPGTGGAGRQPAPSRRRRC